MKLLGFILIIVVVWKITPPDVTFLVFLLLVIGCMAVLNFIAKLF